MKRINNLIKSIEAEIKKLKDDIRYKIAERQRVNERISDLKADLTEAEKELATLERYREKEDENIS